MRFYIFVAAGLISVFAVGSAVIKNFDFFRKIPASVSSILNAKNTVEIRINTHLVVSPQKGVYSTEWTAKAKGINNLINLADTTEINSIVIDVKDSGVYLDDYVKNLVSELHSKNIYTIARIVVFQDNSQIKTHPDWYFKKENGGLWKDNRGWHWLDPTNKETWDYNVDIAKQAIATGFDEINFDYVRFPAFSKTDDVDLSSLISEDGFHIAKSEIINQFSAYLTTELKKYDPYIKLSVDLFAYNMLKTDDLGVGQKFTELYGYFDYICPMIYPSHYLPGNFGFDNPVEHPYEVISDTIKSGENQLRGKIVLDTGTTTPAIVNPTFNEELKKLRPWLQDFDIGAIYDGDMIRKEKQAVYDAGLTSGWLLWNPNNVYTASALDK